MASLSFLNGDIIPATSPGIILLTFIISATTYAIAVALFSKRLVDGEGNSIPKGPVGVPIIGMFVLCIGVTTAYWRWTYCSLGSFPFLSHYPELTLDYWSKKFGPLYSMWLGNQLFVVVSDPVIVKDLLINNGTIFSSRKDTFIKSQTIFAGRGITVMPYGPRW